MRKKVILTTISLITLGGLLTSCGEKEQNTTYSLNKDGVKTDIIITHKGDEVTRQASKIKIPYESLGVLNKKQAKEQLETSTKTYEGIDGLTFQLDYKEKEVIQTLEVDFDKIDYRKAKGVAGLNLPSDPQKGIKLEESEKIIKKLGFKEEK